MKLKSLLASMLILASAAVCSAEESHPPSVLAKDVAGAKGTMVFKPSDHIPGETTWWKDSDGVAPDVAGCHIGTDEKGNPNGRFFGEACLSGVLLVESNPGPEQLHSHADDTGHPDSIDCNDWCLGQGKKSGVCEAAAAPPCKASALCKCR